MREGCCAIYLVAKTRHQDLGIRHLMRKRNLIGLVALRYATDLQHHDLAYTYCFQFGASASLIALEGAHERQLEYKTSTGRWMTDSCWERGPIPPVRGDNWTYVALPPSKAEVVEWLGREETIPPNRPTCKEIADEDADARARRWKMYVNGHPPWEWYFPISDED
jgi:hypothetical protein